MEANRGLLGWFFQRITAAVLAVGLIVHFLALHFLIERPVTMDKVAERLGTPGWIAFDAVLLVACLFHALNGLYAILADFRPARAVAGTVRWAFWVVGIAATVVGVANLIPFGR